MHYLAIIVIDAISRNTCTHRPRAPSVQRIRIRLALWWLAGLRLLSYQMTIATHISALCILAFYSLAEGQPSCRNKLVWPYASTSVWNTPIGSLADYQPANIFQGVEPRNGFFSDDDYFIVTTASDPLVPWFDQGWWGVPEGTAHCNITGSLYTHIAFPATLTVTAFGNNNGAAILQPDGHTLVYTQPLYVCTPGAPVLSIVDHKYGTGDIAGNGTWGGHGGSGLNAIGGTIRLGELMRGAPPMQHALKIELLAYQYYYGPAFGANRSTCFHWPAVQCVSTDLCAVYSAHARHTRQHAHTSSSFLHICRMATSTTAALPVGTTATMAVTPP